MGAFSRITDALHRSREQLPGWRDQANHRPPELDDYEPVNGPRPITDFLWSVDPKPEPEPAGGRGRVLPEGKHPADRAARQASHPVAEKACPEPEAGA
jgi:hypothetical protein